jgi:hypothetical protein
MLRKLWDSAGDCRLLIADCRSAGKRKSKFETRKSQVGGRISIFDSPVSSFGLRGQSSIGNRKSTIPAILGQTMRACLALCMLSLFGCRLDMHVQPKYKPLDPSTFFDDGRSARPEVPGTVAHGHLRTDELLFTGKVNGEPSEVFPFPITREVLERGRERYNIFCSPCHDYTGSGRGMVVQRGFPPPPSYHLERLVKAPVGHFFEVITNGYGAMYSYASRVTPEDRWAIVAYIRALQMSQHATLEDVPPQQKEHLTELTK